MTRAFARKDFLNLVGGTGLLTVLGCAAEDPAPSTTGGAAGTAGGSGTSGSSGTAGGGAAGGGAGGTSGGTSGGAGSGGGAGTGGSSGSAGSAGGGQGGSAGSQAGGGGAGSGGGGAGSGGASGDGQGGTAGSQAGGGQGGAQGGTAGGAGSGGGGQGGSAGGGDDACTGEIEAEISMNHNHALTVPMADIMAGVAKIYDAQGTANHPHYVELTADDFATLRAGGTVKKVSCSGGDHEYVLSCGTASETAGNPMCMMSDNCGGTMQNLCPDP